MASWKVVDEHVVHEVPVNPFCDWYVPTPHGLQTLLVLLVGKTLV
jgi:hypothetical protein